MQYADAQNDATASSLWHCTQAYRLFRPARFGTAFNATGMPDHAYPGLWDFLVNEVILDASVYGFAFALA